MDSFKNYRPRSCWCETTRTEVWLATILVSYREARWARNTSYDMAIDIWKSDPKTYGTPESLLKRLKFAPTRRNMGRLDIVYAGVKKYPHKLIRSGQKCAYSSTPLGVNYLIVAYDANIEVITLHGALQIFSRYPYYHGEFNARWNWGNVNYY